MQNSNTYKSAILIASASIIFSGYFATLSPSVAGGDTGELLAEGWVAIFSFI